MGRELLSLMLTTTGYGRRPVLRLRLHRRGEIVPIRSGYRSVIQIRVIVRIVGITNKTGPAKLLKKDPNGHTEPRPKRGRDLREQKIRPVEIPEAFPIDIRTSHCAGDAKRDPSRIRDHPPRQKRVLNLSRQILTPSAPVSKQRGPRC